MIKKLFGKTEELKISGKSQMFLEFLNEIDVHMDSGEAENGDISFFTDNKLDCGQTVRVLVTFDKEESTAFIYFFNYVTVQNKEKLNAVYKTINELQMKYMFTTFYCDEKDVVHMQYFIDISHTYSPKTIMDQIRIMLHVAEKSYPEFMKAVWS